MTNEPQRIADALNGILADCYAIYLKAKSFHWHVSGAHFRDYHLLLDEQAAQILAITDPMAERIRKRGGTTLRSIGHIGRLQTIKDNDAESIGAHAMLNELRADNQSLVEGLRAAREVAEREGDSPTSSLIDDWIDQAEGRVWFLTEAVAKG